MSISIIVKLINFKFSPQYRLLPVFSTEFLSSLLSVSVNSNLKIYKSYFLFLSFFFLPFTFHGFGNRVGVEG